MVFLKMEITLSVNYMLRKSVFQKVSDNMQKSVGAVLTVSN